MVSGCTFPWVAGVTVKGNPQCLTWEGMWVGLDKWLVNVSWLGKFASVFWWMELDFFSLECNEVSSNEL